MSTYAYLGSSKLDGAALSAELEAAVVPVAEHLLAQGVDAAQLEVLSELLARWATELTGQSANPAAAREATAFLSLHPELVALLEAAFARALGGREVAALAVHCLDLAERLALLVYVPELPSLTAKSDRTGDAARSVGVAKRLRG